MTKEDFIKQKAEEGGITVKDFHRMLKTLDLHIIPCDCGHKVCQGWLLTDRHFIS